VGSFVAKALDLSLYDAARLALFRDSIRVYNTSADPGQSPSARQHRGTPQASSTRTGVSAGPIAVATYDDVDGNPFERPGRLATELVESGDLLP
jgi:hypothetical protein